MYVAMYDNSLTTRQRIREGLAMIRVSLDYKIKSDPDCVIGNSSYVGHIFDICTI